MVTEGFLLQCSTLKWPFGKSETKQSQALLEISLAQILLLLVPSLYIVDLKRAHSHGKYIQNIFLVELLSWKISNLQGNMICLGANGPES